MSAKNIAVGEATFPCTLGATVDQAEDRIRTGYSLAYGYLEDASGAFIDGTAPIRYTTGEARFVGGQPAQRGNIIPPHMYLNIPLLFNETNTMASIIYCFCQRRCISEELPTWLL
jgi:hypothetical protein